MRQLTVASMAAGKGCHGEREVPVTYHVGVHHSEVAA